MPKRGRPPNPVRPPGKRGRLPGQKNKKKGLSFKRAIFKTMRVMNPLSRITKSGMDVMNSIVLDAFKSICKEAASVCECNEQIVLTHKAVESATKMKLDGEMLVLALFDSRKAVKNYQQYKKKKKC